MAEKTITARPLPTPAELPDADVLIFDGDCRFCQGQVARIRRWSGKRVAFLSLHDPAVAERYPDLSHDDLMKQMYVVDRRGHRFGGARALRYLTRLVPWFWPFAPLLHIPFSLPVWNWLYQQVAQRRYRISGKLDCDNGACRVHFK